MNIPSKVKIGGIEYKVVNVDNLHLGVDKCNGTIHFNKDVIELDTKLSPQRKEETFLHEIVHSITEHMCLDLGEEEEKVVESISKGLHMFMVQNPKVFCNKES